MYYSFSELSKHKNKFKKVFFYRICGTGMGAAACLMKEKGYEVEGGDMTFYPPMGPYLESTGIKCHTLSAISPDFLKTFDLIVVGNVVAKNSEHAKLIESLGIPYASFPATLGALVLSDLNVVGIAGTHGKTTTTYLATQIFEKLGLEPGYLIGGVMEDRPSAKLGKNYFFIESDEYDSAYFEKISKFRLYSLDHLILTSLEFDHADIFESVEAIEDEFRAVIPHIQKSFLFSEDYSSSLKLLEETKKLKEEKIIHSYGLTSVVGPIILKKESTQTSFSLNIRGENHLFVTSLTGTHNILNLSAVILFASAEGFDLALIKKAVLDLKMVRRRQEERGFFGEALVIDDFAHHPRAVSMTIDGIKTKYPDKKIIVVFEPRSATARSSLFQKEFVASFSQAEALIIAHNHLPTSVNGGASLDVSLLADDIRKEFSIPCMIAESKKEILSYLNSLAQKESLVLILSNGTCLGLWEDKDWLKK